jgi:lipoprotein-anchoring transpeptidase ErfK/SrfK
VHDIKFISPDPPGSPNYYNPTPIHWGLLYSYYGYFLHDAWWRAWFGKYSNLPHYDPISFNNGSHGCINFPLSKMQWLYDWASIGTPVIVY